LGSDVKPDASSAQMSGDAEEWLRSNGVPTQDGSFRTLGGQPFTFIVYGDTQEQYPWFTQMDRHKLVADYIAQEKDVSFVVHVGDFTYDADDADGWDMFFKAAQKMLANVTIYPVMGNHEHNSPVYSEIFGMPQHYQFRSGEARFLVLDTNSWADLEAQRRWLQDAFSSASKWDFVFYHHPSYSSDARNYGGWELSRTHWEDIFVEAGVSAVFSGHVHAYERYLVRGLNYFVVGTGGGTLSDLSPEIPAGGQNRLAKTLGYARVTVDSDEVTVDFIQVARISDDSRQVLGLYPWGSVFETVTIEPTQGQKTMQSPAVDFRVSPVSLNIDVDSDSSHHFKMRIISSHDAQIYVDTEGLPFKVKPSTLWVKGSEQGQRIELELFGNKEIPNGEYEGKLTFLRDVGDHVALGVKVKTTVSQTGEEGVGFLESVLENNLYLVVAVVLVVLANIGGYVAYRKYKARIARAKDI
jgi:predicted phosphodiesterase